MWIVVSWEHCSIPWCQFRLLQAEVLPDRSLDEEWKYHWLLGTPSDSQSSEMCMLTTLSLQCRMLIHSLVSLWDRKCSRVPTQPRSTGHPWWYTWGKLAMPYGSRQSKLSSHTVQHLRFWWSLLLSGWLWSFHNYGNSSAFEQYYEWKSVAMASSGVAGIHFTVIRPGVPTRKGYICL